MYAPREQRSREFKPPLSALVLLRIVTAPLQRLFIYIHRKCCAIMCAVCTSPVLPSPAGSSQPPFFRHRASRPRTVGLLGWSWLAPTPTASRRRGGRFWSACSPWQTSKPSRRASRTWTTSATPKATRCPPRSSPSAAATEPGTVHTYTHTSRYIGMI